MVMIDSPQTIASRMKASVQRSTSAAFPDDAPVSILIDTNAAEAHASRVFNHNRNLAGSPLTAIGRDLDAWASLYNVSRRSLEDDDGLRIRVVDAIRQRGGAGSTETLKSGARAASALVQDAMVSRDATTGVYTVSILATEAGSTSVLPGIATPSLLSTVRVYLTDDDNKLTFSGQEITTAALVNGTSIDEYFVGVTITSDTPSNVLEPVIRQAIYSFIDQNRAFGQDIIQSQLIGALASIRAVKDVTVNRLSTVSATDTSVGNLETTSTLLVYSCKKDTTSVNITVQA